MPDDAAAATAHDELRKVKYELGRYLALLRTKAGYSQRHLARRINYSPTSVANAEAGKDMPLRIFWQSCERVLGLEPGELTRSYEVFRALRTRQRFARASEQIAARIEALTSDGVPVPQRTWPDEDPSRPVAVIIVCADGSAKTALLLPTDKRERTVMPPAPCPPHVYVMQEVTIKGKPQMVKMCVKCGDRK